MSRSPRDAKGGKRVKKEQRPSRRGIQWAFVACCVLAIALLALWQTGAFPFLCQQQTPAPIPSSSAGTSAEPDPAVRQRRTSRGISSWSTAGTLCRRATSPS